MFTSIMILLFFFLFLWLKFNFSTIKGRIGEAFVNRILSKLDRGIYQIYHDVYVPNNEGGTTQIDHIVTSPYGIFVIETKHYEGWIFGKEDQKYWTQVIYKRKEKLYNPIWQNYGHVSALKSYLNFEDNTIHSIIAFSNNSTFKFDDHFKKARVIQFRQLLKVIKEYNNPVISMQQLLTINSRIEKLTSIDKNEKKIVKKDHLERVKLKKKSNSISSNTNCPKCGGNLVERKGKYGNFQGCSNFPKCRYTKQQLVNKPETMH